MSEQALADRPTGVRRPQQLSWLAIAVFGVALCYIDGFWATSIHGATGAIERTQGPFLFWLRSSTLMLPLYVGAVVGALLLARKLVGGTTKRFVKPLVAGGLILVLGTLVAIGQVTATARQDYLVQARHLEIMEAAHGGHGLVTPPAGQTAVASSAGSCTGVCQAKAQTRAVHVKTVKWSSKVLLLTNLVVVLFLLGMVGDHLYVTRKARRTALPLGVAPQPASS